MKYLLFLLFPLSAFAQQICEGNLGENIFTFGDFGSGEANIIPFDPDIAPGYIYTSATPPENGHYTITNNSGNWNNNFPTWLEIPDNSADPNGYFMVVNASFEPGIFYTQTIFGLCENTLYEFSADVINMVKSWVQDHAFPNISFLLDGEEFYLTGAIPQNETWLTFGFTFETGPNVTSLELSLRNNAPGGFGNDLAIDNISFRACGPSALILPEKVTNICEDGQPIDLLATIVGEQYDNPSIQWQQSFNEGQTWQNIQGENDFTFTHTDLASGFYYYRYLLANAPGNLSNSKCRVISNVKIIHVVPKFYMINDTICEGNIYSSGNSTYSVAGTYIDSLTSTIGCDSIVTLNLGIVPDPGIMAETVVTDPQCEGDATGSIFINAIANGTPPLEVTMGELMDNGVGLYSNLLPGTYPLVIRDRFGCSLEQDIVIAAPAPFTVELGPDLSIDLGEQIDISPIVTLPIASFSWTPESGIICEADCFGLQGFPIESNNYILTAFSEDGCQAVDSVYIEVKVSRKVYVPNAFSPNNDGINDYFTVYGENPLVQEVRNLSIFNRWGGIVFEVESMPINQPELGWDGTFNGKLLGPDVFVWVADVLFLDQSERQFSGDVLLLR